MVLNSLHQDKSQCHNIHVGTSTFLQVCGGLEEYLGSSKTTTCLLETQSFCLFVKFSLNTCNPLFFNLTSRTMTSECSTRFTEVDQQGSHDHQLPDQKDLQLCLLEYTVMSNAVLGYEPIFPPYSTMAAEYYYYLPFLTSFVWNWVCNHWIYKQHIKRN